MANFLLFTSLSLVLCRSVIALDEEGTYNDYKVQVKMVGKDDINTTIYQKYMAHLRRKEQSTAADLNRTKNESTSLNLSAENTTEGANHNESSKRPKWFCTGRNMDEGESGRVLLVNESGLLTWINSSNNGSDGCAIAMFYAQFCPFSAVIAPQFNAFGRAYNNTPVLAIDAYKYSSLNARFGVVAVPTILIFHSGKPVLKFNHSKTLDDLRVFVKNYTGLEGNLSIIVTPEDFEGPVSSVATKETDIFLVVSSLFVFSFGLYLFGQSPFGMQVYAKIVTMDWSRLTHWFKPKQE